jgi:hypothetical protein
MSNPSSSYQNTDASSHLDSEAGDTALNSLQQTNQSQMSLNEPLLPKPSPQQTAPQQRGKPSVQG